MKSRFFKIGLVFCMTVAFLFSCEKEKGNDNENEGNNTSVTKEKTIDATAYNKWVYFSFSKGNVVTVDDPENDLNWDMALHRYDVKLNGGTSGKGQGAAIETSAKSLSDVKNIPTEGYVVDVMGQVNMTGMPPVYEEHSMNTEVSKWMKLDTSEMPPSYTMSGLVYILKCADGKIVKVKFTDYTNDLGATAHITFQYEYPVE